MISENFHGKKIIIKSHTSLEREKNKNSNQSRLTKKLPLRVQSSITYQEETIIEKMGCCPAALQDHCPTLNSKYNKNKGKQQQNFLK